MALATDKIEALAPDQASLSAAVKLKLSSWPALAVDQDQIFAWGECQGSGSTPYRVCIQLSDLGYKCNCPSRKFPCKHSLALMLLYAASPQNFHTASTPDWVADWAGRRRGPAAAKPDETAKPRVSLGAAIAAEPEKPRDEKAEARAVQQRERLKAQREASIMAGLEELDRWIEDALNRGLAGFMGEAADRCRILAQRLVDAKAPALATALDALPSQIMALPEPMRLQALIEALGGFHLLAQAYRRQDKLPESLRHDVRRLIGWTIERQALLEDASALRVAAQWTVMTCVTEVQPDRLRRTETWLTGRTENERLAAVLIDFVPVAAASSGLPFLAGERFDAELVYYPSAAPLRAIIGNRTGQADGARHSPAQGQTLVEAMRHYDDMRVVQPWLKQWPLVIENPQVGLHDKAGLWVVSGEEALPVAPHLFEHTLALTGAAITTLAGLWDGRYFAPAAAATSLGPWFRA